MWMRGETVRMNKVNLIFFAKILNSNHLLRVKQSENENRIKEFEVEVFSMGL